MSWFQISYVAILNTPKVNTVSLFMIQIYPTEVLSILREPFEKLRRGRNIIDHSFTRKLTPTILKYFILVMRHIIVKY